MATATSSAVMADVNYQSDRSDGGIYSYGNPEIRRLNLVPLSTRLVDMRQTKPSLDAEGFMLARHEIDGDWTKREWLDTVYLESCFDLVRRETGASVVLPIYYPLVRSVIPAEGKADPARFLHIDQPREEFAAEVERLCGQFGETFDERAHRAKIYNVWKAISPPPQDQPLALCDRRAIDPVDHVLGRNVERNIASTTFLGIAPPREPLTLQYVPDLLVNESLLFVLADLDPAAPLGVAHTAISAPPGERALVPRQSVEMRVAALFD